MQNAMKNLLIIIISVSFLYACSTEDKIKPEDHFSKIYYDSALHNNYFPIDFAILNDNSYLILSLLKRDTVQNTIPGIYIMQSDKSGNSLWHKELGNEFVNAVPQLFKSGDDYYFFSMHATSLETVLFKISVANQEVTEIKRYPEITYPLTSSRDSLNNYLLLGFNSATRSTTLTRLGSDFSVGWQKSYPIIEDIVDKIIYHITRTGKYYPFFTGNISSGGSPTLYYANGFTNYTFSLMFINPSDGTVNGDINGFRYDGGISSFIPTAAGNFLLTRFYYNDQFFLTQTAVKTNVISSSTEYQGLWMPEVRDILNIQAIPVKLNNENVILVAAPTKSNTIGLYFYDSSSGDNKMTQFVGDRYPIEPAAVHQASDGSIVLLCRIYESGKFPRICLVKYSKKEFTW
jgi:hypothetical protein